MRPRDTDEKAAAVAAGIRRALGPEQRFVQAMELNESSEDELVRALMIQLYGEGPRRKP